MIWPRRGVPSPKPHSRPRVGLGGFSLIELLVVIAIIGVLAELAIVSTRYLTRRAADTATLADLRQVASAIEQAAAGGEYPVASGANAPASWLALEVALGTVVDALPPATAGYAARVEPTAFCLWRASVRNASSTIYCTNGLGCSDAGGVEAASLPATCAFP